MYGYSIYRAREAAEVGVFTGLSPCGTGDTAYSGAYPKEPAKRGDDRQAHPPGETVFKGGIRKGVKTRQNRSKSP
jgi:hypothetical protein